MNLINFAGNQVSILDNEHLTRTGCSGSDSDVNNDDNENNNNRVGT